MSLVRVAQFAGVSASTVSRVINDYPRVSPVTAESVRRTMRELNFTPKSKRRYTRSTQPLTQALNIALLIFEESGAPAAPAFEHLVRGVSAAAAHCQLQLNLGFFSQGAPLPVEFFNRQIHGVLIHGEQPTPTVVKQLANIPAVWLMSNRCRPTWGDQVMPDNTQIGEQAAQYLLNRGHRNVAFLSARSGTWALDERALAFSYTAEEGGAKVHLLQGPGATSGDLWQASPVSAVAELVRRFEGLHPRPTGLFVAEDRLLPELAAELSRADLASGPGRDLEIVSCNNESAYLAGFNPMPATIDIRAEAIGRRGLEQLLWRIRTKGPSERIRLMVEPKLIQPPMQYVGLDV